MKKIILASVFLLGAFTVLVLGWSSEGGKFILSGPGSVLGALSITGSLTASDDVGATDDVTSGDDMIATGDVSGVNVTASGDMSAAGGMIGELAYWYQDNVAASQSAVVLNLNGGAERAEIPILRAGSILGIVVYSNEARSAGTLTVDATIDGSVTGLTAVLNGSATQTKVATQAKDADAFTAGQRIGVKITTDGDWAPTTADITVGLLIEQ